jgi:membrane dipeptidase
LAGIDHRTGLGFDSGGGIRGWNDASQTRNVTAGRRRGPTDAQIEQLWSGNLLRVWRDVERIAKTEATATASRKENFDAILRP